MPLHWRHNERDGVSNHQPHDCLLIRLFRHRWNKISKLRVTGLCEGNTPVTGELPAQRASNAENIPIWWRHHGHFLHTITPIHLQSVWPINIFRPRQNGQQFPDDIFKCTFVNEIMEFRLRFYWSLFPMVPINNIPAFFFLVFFFLQIMA